MLKVLETIREVLKFKSYTTISEIAKLSGLKQMEVLKIINKNGDMVWREKKTGRITSVNTHKKLSDKLFNEGRWYFISGVNYGSSNEITFIGHNEIRNKYTKTYRHGGFGDSYDWTGVYDSPEIRKELEAEDCVFGSDLKLDDRMWEE